MDELVGEDALVSNTASRKSRPTSSCQKNLMRNITARRYASDESSSLPLEPLQGGLCLSRGTTPNHTGILHNRADGGAIIVANGKGGKSLSVAA